MVIYLENLLGGIFIMYTLLSYIIIPTLIYKNIVNPEDSVFSKKCLTDLEPEQDDDMYQDDQEDDIHQDDMPQNEMPTYIPRKYRTRKIRKIIKEEKEQIQACNILTTGVMIYGGLFLSYYYRL